MQKNATFLLEEGMRKRQKKEVPREGKWQRIKVTA